MPVGRPRWTIELRGGDYDGWPGTSRTTPMPVLVAWVCGRACDGHATFQPGNPAIVLSTAVSYRLIELDDEERHAVYEVGDAEPDADVEERELVGAGSGLGSGWPVGAIDPFAGGRAFFALAVPAGLVLWASLVAAVVASGGVL